MMNIIQNRNNNQLVIALEGRLDISTAPDLDKVVNNDLDGVTELIFDLEKLIVNAKSWFVLDGMVTWPPRRG